jgi:hypothetical protein
MLVSEYQLSPKRLDPAKESWLESLASMPAASSDNCAWLFETFRRTVSTNPTARAVHFNYARYQASKMPGSEKSQLFEIIAWVESQIAAPGFDWNNLLMQFSILANA